MRTLIVVSTLVLSGIALQNYAAANESSDRGGEGTSSAQVSASLTKEQESWLSVANRHEKAGWIYLHIEGTPRERGFQHGYLLAKEIKETIRVLNVCWKYQTALEWLWLVQKVGEFMTPKVDTENLEELDGMVEGMKAAGVSTSRDELVALNAWMELFWPYWAIIKDQMVPKSPNQRTNDACSAFIATGSMTKDGSIVLGHNTMLWYQGPMMNVILDILPEKGHRILMQAQVGFIHSGTDFFVTDAGLVGTETTIADFIPFDVNGVSEFARMRHATQYASSIDEWCDMMKKGNNGGVANSWLLGDINTNEIARFELGLKYVGFEKKKDGYFVGSNLPSDLKILRYETTVEETNIKHSWVARDVRWKQLMKEYAGKIDVELAKKLISDHYDTYLKKNNPSNRTLCCHTDLDSQSLTGVWLPYEPGGTLDGKVMNAKMARQMSFLARYGAACGMAFDAKKFHEEHPQFDWMIGLIKDRPSQPWTEFKIGEKK